jgi:hypothetical protein
MYRIKAGSREGYGFARQAGGNSLSVSYRTDSGAARAHALNMGTACSAIPADHSFKGTLTMLYTIAVILLVLWALGLVSGTTVGGFVHVLLVIAVIMVLLQLISGRRVL